MQCRALASATLLGAVWLAIADAKGKTLGHASVDPSRRAARDMDSSPPQPRRQSSLIALANEEILSSNATVRHHLDVHAVGLHAAVTSWSTVPHLSSSQEELGIAMLEDGAQIRNSQAKVPLVRREARIDSSPPSPAPVYPDHREEDEAFDEMPAEHASSQHIPRKPARREDEDEIGRSDLLEPEETDEAAEIYDRSGSDPEPQGPKGEPGDQGPKGPNGADGAQGKMGPTGKAGERGTKGVVGNKGIVGAIGETGDQGATGEAGPKPPKTVAPPGLAKLQIFGGAVVFHIVLAVLVFMVLKSQADTLKKESEKSAGWEEF